MALERPQLVVLADKVRSESVEKHLPSFARVCHILEEKLCPSLAVDE